MSASDARKPKPAANAHIASALRTLDTEAEGVAALAAAMSNGLGAPFVAAVDTIRAARGRVIVTGMGKSGHVARKIAATLASTGTPAFFVHAADASHGDLGMITSDDVMLALSWSGETEELKDLIELSAASASRSSRVTWKYRGWHAGRSGRRRVAIAGNARSVSAQSGAHDIVADATRARRRTCDRAPRKQRVYRYRLRRIPSARQIGRDAEIRPRRHAFRRTPCRRSSAVGHDVGGAGRDVRRRDSRLRRRSPISAG